MREYLESGKSNVAGVAPTCFQVSLTSHEHFSTTERKAAPANIDSLSAPLTAGLPCRTMVSCMWPRTVGGLLPLAILTTSRQKKA